MKPCTVFLAFVAAAASANASPPPKPADDASEQAAPSYESAYSGYRRYEEHELASWRELNDEVARLGGGHAHMRSAPLPQPEGMKAPPARPSGHSPMNHGGHR